MINKIIKILPLSITNEIVWINGKRDNPNNSDNSIAHLDY